MRYRIDEIPRILRSPAGTEQSAQKSAREPFHYSHKSWAKTAGFVQLSGLLRRSTSP
jgi:hypothetical protein